MTTKIALTLSGSGKEQKIYLKTSADFEWKWKEQKINLKTSLDFKWKCYRRSRRRQREKIMDGLATWLGTGKVLDTLAAVKDRDLWREMIANAHKQGT
ncbi:hypothetical protein PoB_001828700 [Plakobranchus ocellatus]|uniref:Uncharacterized protein n=1 Tax=Plakobranchus ocellatus TaxID=259542 RepID=A0AAV3ZBC4_9GAST|nr:hypothetical protein PoB_001828700 [Plakobranchus ocellatus]